MKKDNIFERIKNSIYNVNKIATYSKYGVGRAILYALVLATLLVLMQSIYIGVSINNRINSINHIFNEDKYKFEIKNGDLKLKTSPITEENSGMLFYANDKIKISEENKLKNIGINSDIIILVLKDGIIMKSNNPDVLYNDSKFTYSQVQLNNFSNYKLIDLLSSSKIFIIYIISVIVLIKTFGRYLIYTLFISLLSMLNNVIYKLDLKYSEVYSLVIYAGTLPSIIVTIFSLFRPTAYFSTACLVGTLLYTIFIMKEMKKNMLDKLV